MTKATIVVGAFATVLVLLAVAAGYRALNQHSNSVPATSPAIAPSTTPSAAGPHQGFLYGRITTVDGATYEGRLRWGGVEEAFWGDTFNGFKRENRWLALVSPERRPREHSAIKLLGIKLADRDIPIDVRRQLMTSFGEIARIEALGRDVRVWDGKQSVVDLDSLRIRTIEFLPTPSLAARPRPAARDRAHAAGRLHRLRRVGPGRLRRHRRARRPHRRG